MSDLTTAGVVVVAGSSPAILAQVQPPAELGAVSIFIISGLISALVYVVMEWRKADARSDERVERARKQEQEKYEFVIEKLENQFELFRSHNEAINDRLASQLDKLSEVLTTFTATRD